jgi:hypothetical protein
MPARIGLVGFLKKPQKIKVSKSHCILHSAAKPHDSYTLPTKRTEFPRHGRRGATNNFGAKESSSYFDAFFTFNYSFFAFTGYGT